MPDILIINGPNLNMLGKREPGHYGSETLDDINSELTLQAQQHGYSLATFQDNAEHNLIDKIHQAGSDKTRYIIINPAGFTHTSIAMRDALLAVDIPFIEVHLSNIHQRETFRHHSYFSDIASGTIAGLGPMGYKLAIDAVCSKLTNTE